MIAVIAWATGAYSADARAEPGRLVWTAPSDCPDRAWVEARIASHLGRAMNGGEHANVSVETSDAGYRMTVRTRTPSGAGQVGHEHADCSVLADLAALIIAMAIDPAATDPGGSAAARTNPGSQPGDAKSSSGGQLGDAENPTAARFAVQSGDTRLTRRSLAPVRDIRLRARGFVGADRGSLPGLAGGLGVAVAATRAPWRLEASVAYWPARRTTVDEMPQTGGEVSLVVGALRSCFSVLREPARWSLCGLVELGDIAARSFGVSQPGSGRFVWLGVGGATTLAVPLSDSVYFHIDTQLSANLRRPRFTLPTGTVHQPDPLSVRVTSGVELRFR